MFSFEQHPGKTDILFNNECILTIVQAHVWFPGIRISNAKLRPNGRPEFIELLSSTCYGANALVRAHIDCDVQGPYTIRVSLSPIRVNSVLDDLVRETRSMLITYLPEKQRFRYTMTVDLHFLQDIIGQEGLSLNFMPQWGDDEKVVLELDDPVLNSGVGPQVPMTQDWVGMPEPILADDAFTTTWRKRYLSVTLHTAERGMKRLIFNRTANSVQQFYNRHVLKTVPRTSYYYERADGVFLKYTPLFEYPGGHHICEWGYDMHLYALLPKAEPGVLLQQGQQVSLSYQFEEVQRDEMPVEYLDAPAAILEPEERKLADRPIYEEPCCEFVKSALDHPDACAWVFEGDGVWNPSGGKVPGHGALDIHHGDLERNSIWKFAYFGPTRACNPIPPGSQFKISAWIKADNLAQAQIIFTVNHYNGPAMFSACMPFETIGTAQHITRIEDGFALMEFVTEPVGSFNVTGSIVFRYQGCGSASLTDLRVERL
ncbi:MAG: hypothetical protein ACYC7E_02695 [Armatimonadota bacterium]